MFQHCAKRKFAFYFHKAKHLALKRITCHQVQTPNAHKCFFSYFTIEMNLNMFKIFRNSPRIHGSTHDLCELSYKEND